MKIATILLTIAMLSPFLAHAACSVSEVSACKTPAACKSAKEAYYACQKQEIQAKEAARQRQKEMRQQSTTNSPKNSCYCPKNAKIIDVCCYGK